MDWTSKQTKEEWEADCLDLDEKIDNEEQLWKSQGFGLNMLDVNPYLIQIKLNMVVQFLKDELGVSDEELNARLKGEALKQLKHDRGMLIESKMKAQRPDLAVVKTNILGPTGRPII